jgi:YD repeat-containing protein
VKTASVYDACSRLSYQSYPFAGTFSEASTPGTRYEYDPLGRVTRTTNADNSLVSAEFRNNPTRQVTITDENSHKSIHHLASFGDPDETRLVGLIDAEHSQTDGTGLAWQYAYNALGSLTVVAPPGVPINFQTGTRRWTYNTRNQLTAENHPELDAPVAYTYDPAGNLKTRQDPAFALTEFAYDKNDRLSAVTRGDAYDTEIRYDGLDHRRYLRNGHVTSEFAYDVAGRLVTRKDSIGARSFTTGFAYVFDGIVSQITYPTGGKAQYTFDPEFRIRDVHNTGGLYFASMFTYHPSGAPLSFASGSGPSALLNTFTYDTKTYRPKILAVKPPSAAALSSLSLPWNQTFGYDKVDRLTSAGGVWGSGGSYGYDDQGNRLTEAIGGRSRSYVYDAKNRLTGYSGTDSFAGFTYDANGNTTADEVGQYTYTPQNLIETATANGVATTYKYDGDGLRKVRLSPTETRYYIHSQSGHLLSEFRQVGNTLEPVRDYVYAGDRLVASTKPAVFSATPTSLTFTAVAGGTAPDPQTVQLSYTPPSNVSWSATVVTAGSTPWLVLSAVSGTTPSTVTVSIDPSQLPPGTYTGTITFTAPNGTVGSPRAISVLLIVTPTPTLFVTPTVLRFSMQSGALDPASQQVQVLYGLASVAWQATHSAPWLSLSDTSGMTPRTITALVDGAGLAECS